MARKSSISRLPPVIKAAIAGLLKDDKLTLDEILNKIRDEFPDERVPSRSALGRYKKSMDEIGKRLRESREVAAVWAERLGKEPDGDVAKLVMELLRTMAFDMTLSMHEDGAEGVKAGDLNKLALTMQRLEAAGKWNIQREEKMRDAARSEAAEVAVKVAKKKGVSADTADLIRREILGLGA